MAQGRAYGKLGMKVDAMRPSSALSVPIVLCFVVVRVK